MPLTKDDNMVKAVPSDRADEPLTIAILPGRSRRGWPIPNAHRPKTSDENITVDAVAIANEIAWPLLPATSFRQLAADPFSARMRGCSKTQDFTATMLKDEQSIQ